MCKQFFVKDDQFFVIDGMDTKFIPAQALHRYWRNPNYLNDPKDYKDCIERSIKLLDIFNEFCSKDYRIIELGCGIGRNLDILYQNGYKNLFGMDIYDKALEMGKAFYPDTMGKIPLLCSSIEDYIVANQNIKFDVVFTMGVLMHIHPSSSWVFRYITNMVEKYLITAEEEGSIADRVLPYKFKDIFEDCGMKPIFEEYVEWDNKTDDEGIIKIQYRVFKK